MPIEELVEEDYAAFMVAIAFLRHDITPANQQTVFTAIDLAEEANALKFAASNDHNFKVHAGALAQGLSRFTELSFSAIVPVEKILNNAKTRGVNGLEAFGRLGAKTRSTSIRFIGVHTDAPTDEIELMQLVREKRNSLLKWLSPRICASRVINELRKVGVAPWGNTNDCWTAPASQTTATKSVRPNTDPKQWTGGHK
jgi:hypothetical protein